MNKFESFLETVGKDFEKGLVVAVKVAPVVDGLANELFPASIAITAPATIALNLLQNSILTTEQKFAAAGVQSGTGEQKAAEVLTLAGPAATAMLTQAGVPAVDDAYVSDIIDAIVGVLNVPKPVAAA